jgi:peptidoglycan/xylan/chitin deacetylase (PgdA/CDA1 family)
MGALRKTASGLVRLMTEPKGVVRSLPGRHRKIAITIDDGPVDDDCQLIECLARYQSKATFFLIGERAAHSPDIVSSIHEGGHEIGLHSFQHDDMQWMSAMQVRKDILRTRTAIRHAEPEANPTWFRPPFGKIRASVVAGAEGCNMSTALWSVDPQDWRPTAHWSVIAKHVLTEIRPGGIVLLHSGGRHTRDALAIILAGLERLDLEPVTLSELRAACG